MAWLRRLAGAREQVPQLPTVQRTTRLASLRCRGEHHITPMYPALSLSASGRCFSCLPSPSCAGVGLRGLVAPFLHPACLDDLEQLREEGGWPMSAIRARGELRMSGIGAGELCEGPCSFVHAVCVLASGRSRTCHCGFLWRLCRFLIFVIFRRAGMLCRVD